jgi:hypothetical protein
MRTPRGAASAAFPAAAPNTRSLDLCAEFLELAAPSLAWTVTRYDDSAAFVQGARLRRGPTPPLAFLGAILAALIAEREKAAEG